MVGFQIVKFEDVPVSGKVHSLRSKARSGFAEPALLPRCDFAAIVDRENATMMIRKVGAGLLAGGMMIGAPAAAQDSAAVGSLRNCELHIWPTESIEGNGLGGLGLGGLVGELIVASAQKGAGKGQQGLAAQLGPAEQVKQMRKAGFPGALGLAGYRIVVEPPTPSEAQKKADPSVKARAKLIGSRMKSGARLSDSQTPCYAEVIATEIDYDKEIVWKSKLRTIWFLRTFPPGGKVRKIRGYHRSALHAFPAKTPDQEAAATADLLATYQQNLAKFAAHVAEVSKTTR